MVRKNELIVGQEDRLAIKHIAQLLGERGYECLDVVASYKSTSFDFLAVCQRHIFPSDSAVMVRIMKKGVVVRAYTPHAKNFFVKALASSKEKVPFTYGPDLPNREKNGGFRCFIAKKDRNKVVINKPG